MHVKQELQGFLKSQSIRRYALFPGIKVSVSEVLK